MSLALVTDMDEGMIMGNISWTRENKAAILNM